MDDDYGELPDLDSLLKETIDPPAPRSSSAKPGPAAEKVQQPKPQALPTRRAPAAILVSSRQKGNPILNHVRLLPWEYADIPADYVLGATTCAFFLSLKYHRIHPEYIYTRIKALGRRYELRILLVMVDIPNHEETLKELSKTSLMTDLTLILCWSAPEAGHYLELFKSCENAAPTAIRSQQPQSYKDSLNDFITTPRSINKSDAASLMSTFGSLRAAVNAQPEQISSVPGWGERKVQQWSSAVKEDFRTQASKGSGPHRGNASAERSLDQPSLQQQGSFSRDVEGTWPLDDEVEDILDNDDEISPDQRPERQTTDDQDSAQDTVSEGVMSALSKLRNNT